MEIRPDGLDDPRVAELVRRHLADMYGSSPPESVHALDIAFLRRSDITFWSAWDGDELLGCCALKELDSTHGEIKSMRTAATHRRRGAGRALLRHLIAEARRRGYRRLSLETGSHDFYIPARALYLAEGFAVCEPYADYVADPASVFMTREL